MAMAGGVGATTTQLNGVAPAEQFFGEDQGRYIVTIARDNLDDVQDRAKASGVFAPWIGTTGGEDLQLGDARPVLIGQLRLAHESWFPRYMDGPDAIVD